MTKNVRFAFIKKETAVLWGSAREIHPHGQCGMELSDFLPRLGGAPTTSAWSARCIPTPSITTPRSSC
jgi:hypothetical protein